MSPLTEIHTHLTRWTRWYRFQQALHWLWYGLAGGLTLALLTTLVLIFRGHLLENNFFVLVGGSALAGMILATLTALLWPFPPMKAARYFDQTFGLKERTSTALELHPAIADPASAGEPEPARAFALRQLDDALHAARQINPRVYLPIRVRWQEIVLCVVLGLGLFITWKRGDTFFQMAQNYQTVQQAIETQTENLEQLVEEINNDPNLTDVQKEELTQPLKEAIQDLQNAETMEQAVSILKDTEQQMQELTNNQALQQAQDLQNLGQQMNQQADNAGSPLEQFNQDLANGDLLSAANDLANLDPANMTPEELAQAAEQLQQAAEALQDSNPELADQLQQAADALQNGDPQAAQQALQQASQAMQSTAQQAAQAQAAQQAANQAAQGQQQVIQSGQPQNQTAQNGQSQQGQGQQGQGQQGQAQGQNGQGQGQNGQGQGQGQNGQGQGQQGNGGQGQNSGSGAGQGTSQGGASGNEAGNNPIGQGNNPGDGGMTGFEPIGSAPNLGDSGDTITLPNSGETGDNVVGQGNVDPGVPGSSTVPYTDVLPTYSEAATQAIENGLVPPGYRDLIRNYFSSLEP